MARAVPDTRVSRRLRFRDLEVFFAVVRCGSMAKAAAELSVTQPAVSEVVAELEHAFGVKLFDRHSQGVAPTIYAHALLKRGRAAFDELRQGIRDIEFLADPTNGEVRIGCPDSMAGGILAPMIQKFCRDYPGIVISIDPIPTPTLDLPELHARQLDVVLARLSRPLAEETFGDDLNVEILFDDQAVIAAGTDSRWARRRKLGLADLLDASWVGTSRKTFTTIQMERAFQEQDLPMPKMRVVTFSVQVRAHLLATGNFVSAMPKSLLRLNPECSGLKQLPIKLGQGGFPVAIVTLKNRTLSPPAELLLDSLRKHVRSLGLGP
jgi:DNA-binding transcriptional LysR family regulator